MGGPWGGHRVARRLPAAHRARTYGHMWMQTHGHRYVLPCPWDMTIHTNIRMSHVLGLGLGLGPWPWPVGMARVCVHGHASEAAWPPLPCVCICLGTRRVRPRTPPSWRLVASHGVTTARPRAGGIRRRASGHHGSWHGRPPWLGLAWPALAWLGMACHGWRFRSVSCLFFSGGMLLFWFRYNFSYKFFLQIFGYKFFGLFFPQFSCNFSTYSNPRPLRVRVRARACARAREDDGQGSQGVGLCHPHARARTRAREDDAPRPARVSRA